MIKMKTHIFLLMQTFLKILTAAESARILGIFPVFSKSHHSFNQRIVKGLAAKGHQVTIISHFKSKTAVLNYTEILIRGKLEEKFQDWIDSVPVQAQDDFAGVFGYIKNIHTMEKSSCDKVFATEYIRELINAKVKMVDLIMAEIYHLQCFHLLAYKLNVPLVLLTPSIPKTGVEYFVGNPYNPSYVPVLWNAFTTKMNFFQRVENAYQYAMMYWYQSCVFKGDILESWARQVFDMELPSSEELNRRTALALYNNHFSLISRPRSPNFIEIGGVHIEEPKALPKDIENFIEESPEGVIFFSFGSTIKASSIPSEKLKMITGAFSSIPQRILWRVDKLNVTEVPPNVKLGLWFPQRDILEHKKVIAFISHCGISSTQEAIHTATPVIAVPILWDQFRNAKILAVKNVAIYVDYSTMDKNTLLVAINEIITNTKFRETMQTLSKTFKDRPISALDEALYWTEYVLKHQGAPHLRTVGADMPFHQYLLLDVIVFSLGIFLGSIYILRNFFKIIISLACQWKQKKIKTR